MLNTLCWLRRDLRLHDHRPLQLATAPNFKAAVVFVFDKNILKELSPDDRRLTFIYRSLQEIDKKLRQMGSRLLILIGDPTEEIPRLSAKLKIKKVFAGEDYEPKAKKRDAEVKKKLQAIGIEFELIKDQVIFSGRQILTQSQQVYRVFTPYKKNWLSQLQASDYLEATPNLKNLRALDMESKGFAEFPSLEQIGFRPVDLILTPGPLAGQKRLQNFAEIIFDYSQNRNFVSLEGTSMLSPHLRFGTISIREAVRLAKAAGSEGHKTWLNELIWREFYQMILDQFPHVETKAFRVKYQNIQWPGTKQHFKAWCEGRTGFPLVDAAMRLFNDTGWMHNRLRMIVASFLVKDLLVNWRWGEEYFAQHLLDFDLAANNGGWQWSASTGVDAQPYFRIFNPTLQAKRFDPEGEFIREYLPERRSESSKTIYQPSQAIVDHKIQSLRAIKLFS